VKERIPLKKIKNFGPVTLAEFESMGIEYLDQIEALGFEDTCRKWVQYYPERLNANAFLAVACTLDGVVWTKATSAHRRDAHALVAELRSEHGLPPAKRFSRKVKARRQK
jgi:hypothetical protein